jgi:hypothetical protein
MSPKKQRRRAEHAQRKKRVVASRSRARPLSLGFRAQKALHDEVVKRFSGVGTASSFRDS